MTASDIPEIRSAEDGPVSGPGLLVGVGTVAGLGALMASSCCAVPILLASLGAGGAVFSGLEALVNIRIYLLGAASIAILVSWGIFLRQRRMAACGIDKKCAPVMQTSIGPIVLLSLGTTSIALALLWDAWFEPLVFKFLRAF
jgi:mercuric ion transport protein